MNQTSVLGPLPVGVPPHRRADAARPVPRLHGRPAHPDGAAQRAPLLHPRACARVPVLLAAGRAAGTSPGCCTWPRCSTTWPRAAAATTPSSARAEVRRFCREHGDRARRRRADRVPGAAAPDDEPHRAEGRPERPRRDRRASPRQVGNERTPDRAVPADGGRHPRHQPEGLERLEGQAARRPVPPDAARAGRRAARTWTPRSRRASARRGTLLALHAAPLPGTEKPLWDTLDVSYFARHDAADIAWHARTLWRHVEHASAGGARARRRRSAKACRCWSTRPTCPTCSRASAATSTAPASASWTPRCTPRAPATRSTPSRSCTRASTPTTRPATAT